MPDDASTAGAAPPPAPVSVRKKIKDVLTALSLANLCFMHVWFAGLYDKDFGYFNKLPVTSVTLLALVVNILGLAAVIWAGAQVLRRTSNRWAQLTGHSVVCLLLLAPLEFVRSVLLHITNVKLAAFLLHPVVLVVLLVLAGLFLRWHYWAARGVTAVAFVLFPLSGFTLGKVLLLLFRLQTLAQSTQEPSAAPPLQTPPSSCRFVWLIFDEMDGRVAFFQRPPTVQLPEFDRLCRQSLVASNAYPAGGYTAVALPSLISGRSVTDFKPASASELLLTLAPEGQVVPWSQIPSVFSGARELGFNTALVGWYHPYSRVLGSALNYCAWYAYPPFEPARSPTFLATLGRQVRAIALPLNLRQLHVDMHRAMLREALWLAPSTNYGLVKVHFSVPHKPAIYRPEKERVTVAGRAFPRGYLDNLVLADRTFGQLRRAMEAAGTWGTSWVLVTSDHWWREATGLDGRIDQRVPFILKPPGQAPPLTYQPAFDTVITRDLILAILRGDIKTAGELAPWLDRHKVPPRKDFGTSSHPD